MPKSKEKINKTKRAISSALMQLLRDKPISKITINEIAEVSEISRGTIYKYFDNIYAILFAGTMDYYVGINREFEESYTQCSSPSELFDLLYKDYLKRANIIKENPRLFIETEKSHDMLKGSSAYEEFSAQVISIRQKMLAIMQPNETQYSISSELIAICMIECAERICMQWVLNGLKEIAEEIALSATETDFVIMKRLANCAN